MYGLAIIDIVVILIYFVVIIGIGIWSSKRINNQEDYLLGGRKFGKLVQTFASFGQATSADGPVGVATTTFKNGAAGIWSSLLMVFATPLFWITSPWQRRMRVLTMGDFYEERYGSKKMAATYALVGAIGMMGLISVGYTAMNKTIMAITPKTIEDFTPAEKTEYDQAMVLYSLESKNFETLSPAEKSELKELRIQKPRSVFSYINENMLVWIVCLIIIVYAVMGGLEAAFYTDMLQGFFIIVLSVILIPFSWWKIKHQYGTGGESAMQILHEKLPGSFFEIFGAPTLIDFTWYFIIAASLVAGITVVTQPNQLVTNAAAKDEYSARFGFVTGGFLKRFCTIMWGVIGLAAILLYAGKVQNSDLIWGYATRDLLGSLKLGLVGLMVASMMAALMSTADALMLTVSGLILHNVYRPLVSGKSEIHYVWAGRLFGGLFLIGGAIIATSFDSILDILKFVWEFFVIFAAAFWLGLKWRRANRQGAWTSILGTLFIFYLIPVLMPQLFPAMKQNEKLLLQTQPAPAVRTYIAREADVLDRTNEIARWEKAAEDGKVQGTCPKAITIGEEFTKTFELPSKAIFWSKQPAKNKEGKLEARGYFYPELIILHKLGINLQQKPYALNETIRMMIRLVFPFLLLIIVSLLTKPQSDEITLRFFLKMRTRVRGMGHETDAEDIQEAFNAPERTEAVLLFPNTQLEVYKWNKQDTVGFFISVGVVFIVLGTLFAVVNMGG
ncbi:sodium:solute symporter family protein [Roseimarinus sediminis]|uniref:sodium:solute symporter family protein n=1 Tax=Roseimarinus sediminis TaxID=1610899 RepID=UPI003D1FA887